ncbi:MAG: hypothetical protein U1E83_10685 [Methylotetracoccus sp.]
MFKIDLDGFLSHPFHTGMLIADVCLLIFLPFVRPPVVLTLIMVVGLVYLSMYFGAVFARDRSPIRTF